MTGEIVKKTFEEAMARLDEIVTCLEAGDQPLEQTMALFEEGIGLARFCQDKLAAAEGRLEILVSGGIAPFTVEEGGAGRGTAGSTP